MKYRFLDEKKQHIHTLDGEPLTGTSTAVKNVMPPFLAKWGATCAVDFLKERIEKTFWRFLGVGYIRLSDLDKAINAWLSVRKKKAEAGTDMHSDLELYVKHCIENAKGIPTTVTDGKSDEVVAFSKWARANVKRFLYSEVYVFSKDLWLGGIIDVVLELKDGRYVIGDFKSNPNVYFNMYMQAALYDLQQAENGFYTADGEKIGEPLDISAYNIYTFGGGFNAHEYVNMKDIREAAKGLVKINKLLPNY